MAIDLSIFKNLSQEEIDEFPKELMKKEMETNLVLGTNDVILELDYMKVHQIADYKLSDKEKEIATTLCNDGWYGTFDELIVCVKRLAN